MLPILKIKNKINSEYFVTYILKEKIINNKSAVMIF